MGKPRERAPNDKIKKKGGKRPRPAATRRMTAKLREELSQKRRDQEPNAAVAAEEQVEAYTVDAFSAAASTAGRGLGRASQALRERRVEHPDHDLGVDEFPAYPTEEAGPSIHNAPQPVENTERTVLREKEDDLAFSPLSLKKGEFPPEPPVSRGPSPQPDERMKREAIREKREENVRGPRETYKAQSTESEAPPDPPPTFTPREKQVAPREKSAQVLQARERPSTAPPTSRSEAPEVPSPDLPPQPPPPGERMRQIAIKGREAKTIQTGGGEREGPPLSISPADSPAEPREAPPAGSRWTERSPAARQTVDLPDRGGQDMGADPGMVLPATSGIYTGDRPPAGKRQSPVIRERARGDAQVIRERPRATGGPGERQHVNAPAPRTRREAAVPGGGAARARGRSAAPRGLKTSRAAKAAGKTAAGRSAQARVRQLAISRARQAAKATAGLSRKAVTGAVKAAAAMVSALAGLLGGAALLLPLCVVVLAAAVIASPFGIFLAGQEPEPGTVPPNGAIAQVNIELTDYLAELQTGDYADIQLQGQLPDWREVLAVFAVRATFSEDGVDVVTLDQDRVERLKDIFWDMTTITTETDETDAGTVLYLTVEARTADDMRELYGFTDDQNAALDELLAEAELLDGLITDLSVSQADAAALVEALPEDLDPARRAVVETACSLVGKVNYFWGGKSLVLGWGDRWGSLRKVTAEGSPTSGTYRPYGLDCSGMVDWVFYNATGGEYVIGHGGGAAAQHSSCTPILWSEAQPGDLVFYPEDVHVGIVGGRDEDGRLLIIHCASGYNNTVITGLDGFTAIARPQYDTVKATRS